MTEFILWFLIIVGFIILAACIATIAIAVVLGRTLDHMNRIHKKIHDDE
jgi:hypothetical protein